MATPLGDFLRSRRDAVQPEDVGLPPGGRRRVPGLRRSELAQLAGISVEYLVRIEQGRDRHPSVSVVSALGQALRLDGADRDHLRRLAKITDGTCVEPALPARVEVAPRVRRVLDALEPEAAVVMNRVGAVLAWTSTFELVARPTGLLDGDEPNLSLFVFADPRAREVFPEWETVADERAFDLWRAPPEGGTTRLVEQLTAAAGPAFHRRLQAHRIPASGPWTWRIPRVGEVRFDREVLEVSGSQQLVVMLAADDTTAEVLSQLRQAQAPRLRAVP